MLRIGRNNFLNKTGYLLPQKATKTKKAAIGWPIFLFCSLTNPVSILLFCRPRDLSMNVFFPALTNFELALPK